MVHVLCYYYYYCYHTVLNYLYCAGAGGDGGHLGGARVRGHSNIRRCCYVLLLLLLIVYSICVHVLISNIMYYYYVCIML